MCIIAYAKKRKLTKEEFKTCFEKNKDGVGIAYYTGNKLPYTVNYIKGIMKPEKAWKIYEKIDTFPHVVHFRIESSGGVCRSLTHPFLITPNGETPTIYQGQTPILFHNGVWYNWEEHLINYIQKTKIIPEGPVNDTRTMAMLLSEMEEKEREKAINDKVGKWIIMTPSELTRFGNGWEIEDGIEFSNLTYKTYPIVPVKNSWYNRHSECDFDNIDDETKWKTYRKKEIIDDKFLRIDKTLYEVIYENEYGISAFDIKTGTTQWLRKFELENDSERSKKIAHKLVYCDGEAFDVYDEFNKHYVLDSFYIPRYRLEEKSRCTIMPPIEKDKKEEISAPSLCGF